MELFKIGVEWPSRYVGTNTWRVHQKLFRGLKRGSCAEQKIRHSNVLLVKSGTMQKKKHLEYTAAAPRTELSKTNSCPQTTECCSMLQSGIEPPILSLRVIRLTTWPLEQLMS
jgi:hypothetical protein